MSHGRMMRFELYRDHSRQWRWRLRASNGKIVADCAEGYRYRRGALRGIELCQESVLAEIIMTTRKVGEWCSGGRLSASGGEQGDAESLSCCHGPTCRAAR